VRAGNRSIRPLAAAHGDEAALVALPDIVHDAARHYKAKEWKQRRWDTLANAIRDVVDDDVLSETEERELFRLADARNLELQMLAMRDMAVFEESVIAELNDGRLPTVDAPVMLKQGEIARAAFSVALMKDVAVREMQGR